MFGICLKTQKIYYKANSLTSYQNYLHNRQDIQLNNNFTAQDNSDAQISLASDASVGGTEHVGNQAGEGVGALLYIHAPGDGTVRPNITGTGGYWSAGTIYYSLFMGGARLAVITLDRVEVLFSSGNIATGRMTVWGLAHA